MPRRNFLLLELSFGVLIGISSWLWFHGRPTSPAVNPLVKTNLDKVARLVIENREGTITLEKNGDQWDLTTPLKDAADKNIPEDILVALKSFTLGSVVSENPAKHSQFSLANGQGAHLQVFLAGESRPVLDARIGKPANAYEKCYFRFEASTPVYIASNLPESEFQREPKSFRLMKALPVPKGDPLEMNFVQEKTSFDLIRSSETWTTKGGGKPVQAFSANIFLGKLQALTASDFAPGNDTQIWGFEKPYMKATLTTPSKTTSLVLGKKAPRSKGAPATQPEMRYGQTEGRPYVLLIPEDAVKDLLSSYPALP